MEFKIESIIASYIKKTIIPFSLPVKCIFTNFQKAELTSDSSVISYAHQLGYDVVYWGNLYESSLADSNLLEIKGCITNRPAFFRNKKIKFKSLADSVFIKEINDQANTPLYFYCSNQEKNRNFNNSKIPRCIR